MRADNSEKRMFYKCIFLLAVTLLIGRVYLWKWTDDDPKEQAPEEMYQQEESRDRSNGLDEEKRDQILTDEKNNHDEAKEEETQQKQDNEDERLEQFYIQKNGEKEIEQAKEQAETVLSLYLLQITDWEKWDGTVTDNYLKSVQKEMSHSTQESVKRELDEIELFASQPQVNKTITY